ncbi:uncharacterized protein J3D65DRAFT_623194 [Phyllosticta citribraziliensis]|uniref:Secreted protein n=1 Tax=Phyllosticta citribraziliensis TaxID=989973 RepID=A0ABR1LUG4_9PEZI
MFWYVFWVVGLALPCHASFLPNTHHPRNTPSVRSCEQRRGKGNETLSFFSRLFACFLLSFSFTLPASRHTPGLLAGPSSAHDVYPSICPPAAVLAIPEKGQERTAEQHRTERDVFAVRGHRGR